MFLGPWCTINPAHTQLSVKHLKWATSVSLSTLKASGRLGECCSFHVIWKNQEFSAVLWTSVNLTDKPNKIGALCLWDTSSSPPERFSIGHCEEAQSSCYVISTHPFTWVLWEDREHWRCQCAEQYYECRSHQSQPYHSTASHSYYKFITILRTSRTYWRTSSTLQSAETITVGDDDTSPESEEYWTNHGGIMLSRKDLQQTVGNYLTYMLMLFRIFWRGSSHT